MIEQHFELSSSDPERAHEMYHEDAVLEFPQSGERIIGLENIRGWRSNYPASTSGELLNELRTQRRTGRSARMLYEVLGDIWVVELAISYGGGAPSLGVSILEIRDELIARESIYVTETWEAPQWRAQWRAAP